MEVSDFLLAATFDGRPTRRSHLAVESPSEHLQAIKGASAAGEAARLLLVPQDESSRCKQGPSLSGGGGERGGILWLSEEEENLTKCVLRQHVIPI